LYASISGDLLKWISTFLHGRSQCTQINNSYSDFLYFQSGIVQGSVLGPLLFVLYTNDVTDIFDNSSVCKLYADDVKLYTVIENPSDYTDMQKNLNSLQQWSDQ